MKADKIILVVSVFLCFLACGREDVPSTEDTVTVSLNISQEDVNTVGTKSMFPLDPKVENPIADIWVLQYDELGQLCASDHQEKTPSLSIPDHEVTLKRRPTSTIVVFANVGDIAEDDYPWPATIALLRKSRMAVDESLDITGGADPKRLYMVGETVLTADKIQPEPGKTSINVMLSRLCCKLAVGVHQSGSEFHDIKVEIINAAKGFVVFPTVDSFKEIYVDNTYYTDYAEDGPQSVGSARKYFYYYLYENMNKDHQTKIQVTVTGKDGQGRTRIFPITSHGELIRNTYYNVDLELQGSSGS